jgi:DNA-binding response OmpR family regulator
MKNILVIDDNADIRENTAEILELAGYKVFTAENGKKGVEIAIGKKPDIIICDIMMPELDGYGVLHLVRKNPETEFIPFIFLTAKTERSDFRKGMEMGADDYITKPFDEIELLSAVEARFRKIDILQRQYNSGTSSIREFVKDIKQAGIFKDLAEKYDIQEYNKKQLIYQEGKRPRHLFYVIKGKIKAFKSHDDVKEYITDLFGDGDLIGYSALIEDKNYDDSAEVLEDAEVLQIPKDDFLQMIYTDIGIAGKFIRLITQNVKEKEDRLVGLAYGSLRKRVGEALLAIHSKFNEGQSGKLVAISREDIAQYVGTATESLIRTLGDFKAEKLIEIREGKIIIPEPARLKNLPY